MIEIAATGRETIIAMTLVRVVHAAAMTATVAVQTTDAILVAANFVAGLLVRICRLGPRRAVATQIRAGQGLAQVVAMPARAGATTSGAVETTGARALSVATTQVQDAQGATTSGRNSGAAVRTLVSPRAALRMPGRPVRAASAVRISGRQALATTFRRTAAGLNALEQEVRRVAMTLRRGD